MANARGIVLNTPDVPRGTFYFWRVVQALIFAAFLFALWLISKVSYWLIVPAWFLGIFFVNGEYLRGYRSSQRDLDWARTVLSEVGEVDAPVHPRSRGR